MRFVCSGLGSHPNLIREINKCHFLAKNHWDVGSRVEMLLSLTHLGDHDS